MTPSQFPCDSQWSVTRDLTQMVSRYLIKSRQLRDNSPVTAYDEVNELALQLAMLLPEPLYRQLVFAAIDNDPNTNPLTVAIAMRKHILGEEGAGKLLPNDLAFHAPNIGRPSRNPV